MKKNLFLFLVTLLFLFFNATVYGAHSFQQTPGADTLSVPAANDIPTDSGRVMQGRELFSAQCATCHAIGYRIMGPALASVDTRKPLDWLIRFIQNSQQVINSGDEYANFLYEQYNRQVMPPMQFLSKDEIISILAYIKYESSPPAERGGVNSNSQNESQVQSGYVPPESLKSQITEDDDNKNLGVGSKILFGILIVVTLVVIAGILYMLGKGIRR